MPTHDVFISYGNDDKPLVDKLVSYLENHRISCWRDGKEIAPGADLIEHIRDGLEQSAFYLVVLTKTSVMRPWVNAELLWAFQNRAKDERIIQVIMNGCDETYLPEKAKKYLRIEITDNDYESGCERIVRCILQRQSPVDIKLRRGHVALSKQEYAAAIGAATDALVIAPDCKEALNLRAFASVRSFVQKEGLKVNARTLAKLPESVFRLAGPLTAALGDLETSLSCDPDQVQSLLLRAEILNLRGEPSLALQDADDVLLRNPDHVRAIRIRARSLYLMKSYVQALEQCTRGLELRKQDAEMHMLKGEILFDMERFDESAKAFTSSVRWKNSIAARLKLAMSLERNRKIAEAASQYERALDQDKENAGAWGRLGWVYYHLERFQDAETAFAKGVGLDGHDASIVVGRGWARLKSGNLDGAILDADRALELDPSKVRGILLRAECEFAKSAYHDAVVTCEQITSECDCARAFELQNRAYSKAGNSDAAKAAGRRALELVASLVGRLVRRSLTNQHRRVIWSRDCGLGCCGNDAQS